MKDRIEFYFYKIRLFLRQIRHHGIRYPFDKKYRQKLKNKKHNERAKKVYGSSFRSNRKIIKTKLFRRDGNICSWCGQRLTFKTATVDHIVKRSEGGSNALSNLRLLHAECHKQKDNPVSY